MVFFTAKLLPARPPVPGMLSPRSCCHKEHVLSVCSGDTEGAGGAFPTQVRGKVALQEREQHDDDSSGSGLGMMAVGQ